MQVHQCHGAIAVSYDLKRHLGPSMVPYDNPPVPVYLGKVEGIIIAFQLKTDAKLQVSALKLDKCHQYCTRSS